MINATEVVSSCLHLSAFAGEVIRQVVHSGADLGTINKSDVGIAHFDPQTVADRRAQQRIVESLRQFYGESLQIVGEEGHLEPPVPEDVITPITNLLESARNMFIDPKDFIVWIDPLDGTRKFTEKQYDQVSVLIGVSYKGRPLAGVMHLPFVGSHGTTYYGGPLFKNVFVSVLHCGSKNAQEWEFQPIPVPSPSSSVCWGISESACLYINTLMEDGEKDGTYSRLEKGATGILILDVVLGNCQVYARWIPRTKKWDTCVGEAFLLAMGGIVTNIFGEPYEYAFAEELHENKIGVLASVDRKVVEQLSTAARELRDRINNA
ncbi:3'(2'),5'-bisphosphate nucleotidase [Thraustotheca clavata]|uniref:3'(2'),5'-bisphosphate nucleotidase n=1 Tax=Thraustotheca clavata TaxID=74557 RepID=A0A1V9ZPW2_9STRA|nr:3'(2'),5'-bisphosphate nucleotidase [Thraustotheca clavata]